MSYQVPSRSDGPSPQFQGEVDLSQIFIGREQQFDFFNLYVQRWKTLMAQAGPEQMRSMIEPTPYHRIQGLLVLLYGHGGFGKTTLLRRFRGLALQDQSHSKTNRLIISEVVDWEFAVEGKRWLFDLPHGHEPDPGNYYKLLCRWLAWALNKSAQDFKQFQKAYKFVEEAHQQARQVEAGLLQEEQYKEIGELGSEGLLQLLRWTTPRLGQALDQAHLTEYTQQVLGRSIEIGVEQLTRVYGIFRSKLGTRFDAWLDSALQLGLALGRDLAGLARNYPVLLFFDTYEEVDEGDRLLRIVMGAAGLRVGWVLAGRDNLWAGVEQHRRWQGEYGYKDLVSPDRALAIDFKAGGVGAFTTVDILAYFDQLCRLCAQAGWEPSLPQITRKGAEQIWEVTQGVPLAVKIAAGLYLETASLKTVTSKVGGVGRRTIIDEMVRRYLRQTRSELSELQKLYRLALLPHADRPNAVAAALGLTPEQASSSFAVELARLHRQYSFIFTEKNEPTLHQEVRHFLRLWLLEHRSEPEILALNEHLKTAHEAVLMQMEVQRHSQTGLKERLHDEEWVEMYLDLVEQQFWLDPADSIYYALPIMVAGAIFAREVPREVAQVGLFFEAHMKSLSRQRWRWIVQGLTTPYVSPDMLRVSNEERESLREIEKLTKQRRLAFPRPLPDFHDELEALLQWRLGDAWMHASVIYSEECYKKALTKFPHEEELQTALTWNQSLPLDAF